MPTCWRPIADEVAKKADVMLIGYAGGGVRNIFINKPMGSLADIKGLKVRVQGAPIWSRTFAAAGMSPTVIAYNEVYNAIQNNVISAGENEAAGVEVDEVLRGGAQSGHDQHAITIRPICFSAKTFKALPPDLQQAIVKAGKEAGAYGRQVESSEDEQKLEALEKAGKLKRIPFKDRAEMDEAGGSRDGRLRQGDRRGGHLRQDQRDQVMWARQLASSLSHLAGRVARAPGAGHASTSGSAPHP